MSSHALSPLALAGEPGDEVVRRLVDLSLDLLCATGRDGYLKWVNPAWERTLGWTSRELLERRVVELVHPDDVAATLAAAQAIGTPDAVAPFTNRLRGRDGGYRWFTWHGSPMDEQGLSHAIGRDVTAQRRAEAELREREAVLHETQEIAGVGSWAWDTRTGATGWSEELYRILGLAPGAVTPSYERFLTFVHPADRSRVEAEVGAALADGSTYSHDYRIVWTDGTVRIHNCRARTERYDDGRLARIVGTCQDITDRIRAAEALRESEERFRLFVEHSSDVLLLLDATGRLEFVSPAIERVLGSTPASLLQTAAADHVHPDDWGPASAAIGRAFEQPGTTHMAQVRLRDASGAWRLCEAIGRTGGWGTTVRGLIVSLRDMTAWRESEAARRAEEARFRALIENAHDIVGIISLDGRILYESPAVERALGYRPEELVGRDAAEMVHPDDVPRVGQVLARLAAASGAAMPVTYRCRHRDGSWRTLEAEAWNLAHEPAVGGIVVNARDVTEQAAAAAALRESEERFRALSASSPDGIFQADREGDVTYANPSGQQICGATEAELLGRGWTERVHPDDRASLVRAWQDAMAAQSEFETECRVVQPDGTVRRLQVRGAPQRDRAGAVSGCVGTFHDITDRRRAELALAESEHRLRLALRAAKMVAWELDVRNRAFCGSYGGDGAGAGDGASRTGVEPGTTCDEFLDLLHPDDRERVAAAVRRALHERADFQAEFRLIDAGGEQRWRHATGRLVCDGDGASERLVGVTADITERKVLEAQFRQAQKMEAVGQLAGGVAHDFNNLLQVITTSTLFARESMPPGTPGFEELAAVDEAAERAARLTRQLLAFSRRQLLSPEETDLNEVVRGVEPMLRRLIGEDIAVLTIAAPALHSVLADPGQLEQVLVNLAVNARDAMPHGGRLVIETSNVTVTAEAARARICTVPPGRYVRLSVRDTGTGMDEATLGRIFEPFFTTKEPGKGTGLGLATVYGVVKQSAGFVWVTSAPGEGTTFEIDLPAVVAAEAPEASAPAGPTAPARGTETILLVEDEAPVRALVRRLLARQGYTVLEATNGQEALAVAASHRGDVDLVLTDVVMPELNGRASSEQLAARYPGLRVLFMSGYTDDEILRRGLHEPGMTFLVKPFTAQQLLDAVRGVLDGDRMQ